ncbi:hypothetical protein [Spirochaeta cellobiosiphila]|uniref:hypothetical protein n=1 Tax=Spirochaeta cellobiosiphila TaxID=504483 RepID=UPI00041DD6B9|nr:hypothetical protein [Spirochaeta cellobiosiphila]
MLIKSKINLLGLYVIVDFILSSLLSVYTMQTIKINGDLYNEIILTSEISSSMDEIATGTQNKW